MLWSWGSNAHGRLGDGTVINRHSPVRVMDNVTYVALGRNYAFAIRGDGGLYAWGQNSMGSLGDGSGILDGINRHSPVRILNDVINMGVGINRPSWAIRNDNSLWAWDGFGGQIIADFANVNIVTASPIRITENVFAMDIPVLGGWFLLLRPNGDLYGYGSNNSGQLGDGTGIDRDNLVRIMNNVVSVYASSRAALAVRSDNSLWGWGSHSTLQNINGDLTSTGIAYSPIKLIDNVLSVIFSSSLEIYILKTDGTFWVYRFGRGTLLMDDIAIPLPEVPNLIDRQGVLGNVLYSDVRAVINGNQIPSFNIAGNTMIIAEDLMRYGFHVTWDGVNSVLSVVSFDPNRPVDPLDIELNVQSPGTVRFNYFATNIRTFVDGVEVDGFNIGGQTIIWFDHLAMWGDISWDGATMTISLVTVS